MSNIANVVFTFLKDKEQTATEPFYGADVLPSLQDPVKKFRTVRVDNVTDSKPAKLASGNIRRLGAKLAIEILVKPSSDKLEHLLEARAQATAIADQIFELLEDSFMNGEKLDAPSIVCDYKVDSVRDFWGNIQTKKYALTYLFLTFNNR